MKHAAQLFANLNPTCRTAFEAAIGLAVTHTHYEVDIDHLFAKLAEVDRSDIAMILERSNSSADKWRAELTRRLDRFRSGNSREAVFSPNIPRLVSEAWVISSAQFGGSRIRSGHLLLAVLTDEQLGRLIQRDQGELRKVSADALFDRFLEATAGSIEDEPAVGTQPGRPAAAGTGALDKYTVDLTERARSGRIDNITGRDEEIRRMVSVLLRRRQNNPILTGEAGVGKTAVVEGLALRIARGDVPTALQDVVVRSLDLALLQAGAGVRGEFENRLKSVIDEVKASPKSIILFIDEAHTLIGAGGAAGQNDAANLLKPALARGELRTIAATTREEFKKFFEKDDALSRRFTEIKVEEPSPEAAIAMLRHVVPGLEAHHRVRIFDEAVDAAVRLSVRYLTGRKLPDKAVSVLDTACAKVGVSQTDLPAAVEDSRRRVAAMNQEHGALTREQRAVASYDARIAELEQARTEEEARLEVLTARWNRERELTKTLVETRASVESGAGAADDRSRLDALSTELGTLQGESPLVHAFVDAQAVAEVIASWTGIPLGKMKGNEISTVLDLRSRLEQRVYGQGHALDMIARRIQVSRAGLEDQRKPVGVFLLAGPSGVGKTETALALADALFGGEHTVVTINMSEYQEAHSVSNLKGSPKGYVGYGEGGVLTEAVRRRPYSVVLLDEVEKAHPDVLELFFQVFDKGRLKDSEGEEVDFRNTVILLTSNLGTDTIMTLCADEETRPDADVLTEHVRTALLESGYSEQSGKGPQTAKRQRFSPALLGRIALVPYYPMSPEVLRQVIALQLGKIRDRIAATHRARFEYGAKVFDAILKRCTDAGSGARQVEHILAGSVLPAISQQVLARLSSGHPVSSVSLDVAEGGDFHVQVA